MNKLKETDHYRKMMELINEQSLILKKLKKKRLKPEEREKLENCKTEILDEMKSEREKFRIAELEQDDWEITFANFLYNNFRKKKFDKESAQKMAKFGIEELYRIHDKVVDTIQKENEAEEFFKKYPKLLPKKKWYKLSKVEIVAIIWVLFSISLGFLIFFCLILPILNKQ